MKKPYLVLAAVTLAFAAAFAPAALARQQAVAQFEYGTLVPSVNHVLGVGGYRFCLATASEWSCREFKSPNGSASELHKTLAPTLNALGQEGWELVQFKFYEANNTFDEYLFKRRSR